jgi:diketogulonate reductase-like aldo/keto reductase
MLAQAIACLAVLGSSSSSGGGGGGGGGVALHAGSPYPMLGLGTAASGVRAAHIASALRLGFRLFDTAQSTAPGSADEREVGAAVAASAVPREEVFLQTKVHPDDFPRLAAVFPASLRNLRTSYVDALLMHGPGRGWRGAWRAMEALREAGKARHLGVSNFDAALLTELLDAGVRGGGDGGGSGGGGAAAAALRAAPAPLAVVQNWMDPFHQDEEVRELCAVRGVQYQAFSSLGGRWRHLRQLEEDDDGAETERSNPVLAHPLLVSIAKAHNRSVPLVVLRWQQQLGVSVIPASRSRAHQEELAMWLRPGGPIGWDSVSSARATPHPLCARTR